MAVLRELGADAIVSCGRTPWRDEPLCAAGSTVVEVPAPGKSATSACLRMSGSCTETKDTLSCLGNPSENSAAIRRSSIPRTDSTFQPLSCEPCCALRVVPKASTTGACLVSYVRHVWLFALQVQYICTLYSYDFRVPLITAGTRSGFGGYLRLASLWSL